MAEKPIKAGAEIIRDFLAAIEENPSVDKRTLAVVKNLWSQNLLSTSRLQQELEGSRGAVLTNEQD